MSTSRREVAFGWVPNIGGTVTSEGNLKSKVDGRSLRIPNSDWEFSFSCDVRKVSVSINGMTIVEIEARDDSGLCIIYDTIPVPKSSVKKISVSAMQAAAWSTFRVLIDSSSDVCRCTAMDRPIPFTDGCEAADDACICKAVVRRFIQALENITDVDIYVDEDPHTRARSELDLDSVVRANVLYLERFLDIYRLMLGKDLEDYRSQVRSRKDKVAMVRAYHSERHRIENASNTEALINASNELSQATRDLISSMAGYSKDIGISVKAVRELMGTTAGMVEDLDKCTGEIRNHTNSMVEFTDSSKRTGRWMALLTVASVAIALTSLVYAIFFDPGSAVPQ